MARCQCAGSSCSCLIQAGPGTKVTGVGTTNQPYVISSVPNYYKHEFANTATYYINAPSMSEIGGQAVFFFDIADSLMAFVGLPDGTPAAPYPAEGSQFDVIATGSLASSTINWGGAIVTWHGPAPTTTQMGWYRFIFLDGRFAATFIPVRPI